MYTIVDIESTGGGFKGEKIIDIAIYRFDGEKIVDSFTSLVNPGIKIPSFISKLTGIKDSMVVDAPSFEEIAEKIVEITEGAIFVAHNVQYDYGILKHELRRLGYKFLRKKFCTIDIAKIVIPEHPSYSLGKLCKTLEIKIVDRHRASGDALATVELLKLLMAKDDKGVIQTFIHDPYNVNALAPNLKSDKLEVLPEETGTFYLHDKKGEVIFVGKSNFIKDRVFQQLGQEPINKDKKRLYEQVCDVTYEVTGSELLASIIEFYEINRIGPKFNKRQRAKAKPYGIIKFRDEAGYHNLKVKKLSPDDEPFMLFTNSRQAKILIDDCIASFKLCPKLCGRESIKQKACTAFGEGKCGGACIGKEKASYYNAKLKEAFNSPQYKNPNFLIVGEGRNYDEASVVGVFDGRLYGYGFFEKAKLKDNYHVKKQELKEFPDNSDVDKIVRSYLNKANQDRLIILNGQSD